MWCIIGTPHWRFYYGKKESHTGRKCPQGKIRELLQLANIGSMDDIRSLFEETIAEFMENSRNGHSSKTLRTSFGNVEVSVPRDRKGKFEPQLLRKNQASISQDIEEKILPAAKEWQQRLLESVYAIVFLDAIHYPVRSEGQIVKKAVYIAIGIDLDGRKDVLGMWVGENESVKYWATVLNSLKNRGIMDITKKWTGRRQDWSMIHAQLAVFFADCMPD